MLLSLITVPTAPGGESSAARITVCKDFGLQSHKESSRTLTFTDSVRHMSFVKVSVLRGTKKTAGLKRMRDPCVRERPSLCRFST